MIINGRRKSTNIIDLRGLDNNIIEADRYAGRGRSFVKTSQVSMAVRLNPWVAKWVKTYTPTKAQKRAAFWIKDDASKAKRTR